MIQILKQKLGKCDSKHKPTVYGLYVGVEQNINLMYKKNLCISMFKLANCFIQDVLYVNSLKAVLSIAINADLLLFYININVIVCFWTFRLIKVSI